jgi:hypothetical protein
LFLGTLRNDDVNPAFLEELVVVGYEIIAHDK